MNLSELRIGNIIYAWNGIEMVVRSIMDGSELTGVLASELNPPKEFEGMQASLCYAMIKPIPLTINWLLNFGFKEHIGEYEIRLKYGTLNICPSRDWVFDIMMADGLGKMEYVHQLQNLYHSLTGKELTLKK